MINEFKLVAELIDARKAKTARSDRARLSSKLIPELYVSVHHLKPTLGVTSLSHPLVTFQQRSGHRGNNAEGFCLGSAAPAKFCLTGVLSLLL